MGSPLMLLVFGLMLVCTPAIRAFLDGVRDEEDAAHWLAAQSLERLLWYQSLQVSGLLFLAAAMVYWL